MYKKGDKKAALQLMKKKKLVESVITAKDRQYQNLLTMMQQLAQSKQTKELLDIYRTSSTTFKEMLHRQGLTTENVCDFGLHFDRNCVKHFCLQFEKELNLQLKNISRWFNA